MLKSLSNVQIEKICKRNHIKLNGIYSKNEIPKNLKNGSYIINMEDDKPGKKGTHWTAFIKDKNNLYFDSFGEVPPNQIHNLLKKYTYNNKDVQSFDSDACGYYCIAFLKWLQNGLSFKDFVDSFEKNALSNDKIIGGYII